MHFSLQLEDNETVLGLPSYASWTGFTLAIIGVVFSLCVGLYFLLRSIFRSKKYGMFSSIFGNSYFGLLPVFMIGIILIGSILIHGFCNEQKTNILTPSSIPTPTQADIDENKRVRERANLVLIFHSVVLPFNIVSFGYIAWLVLLHDVIKVEKV